MDVLARLEAHEAISTVKARYCRYLDAKDWDGLTSILTVDMVLEVQQDGSEPRFKGREAALAKIGSTVRDAKTAHQIHFSEIEVDGNEALVITPMQGRLVWYLGKSPVPGVASLTGFGHYHEGFVCVNGAWLIAEIKVTTLHVDMHPES